MSKDIKKDLVLGYKATFKYLPEHIVTAGGRLEIIGNHTDHNHGLCIVGNCSLRIRAAVKKEDDIVKIFSKGHDYFEFYTDDLSLKVEEYSTTKGMVRGILAKCAELGYAIGGFSAYIESEIPEGSGVSSSAAFEVLVGEIINYLYNDRKIPSITLAKIGQFSENVYFHKPSGLLDQIGAAFKDCNFIDFENISNPIIETLDFRLPVTIYLINSEGDHSSLTHLYAAIPDGMRKVSNALGVNFLRETTEQKFIDLVKSNKFDDPLAINKATNFFLENKNVLHCKDAITNNDIRLFFDSINSSQLGSDRFLENTFVKGEYEESPQHIIDRVKELPGFRENGAIRIHGGGFKGSVLTFVKNDYKEFFEEYLRLNFKGRYTEVSISKEGTTAESL